MYTLFVSQKPVVKLCLIMQLMEIVFDGIIIKMTCNAIIVMLLSLLTRCVMYIITTGYYVRIFLICKIIVVFVVIPAEITCHRLTFYQETHFGSDVANFIKLESTEVC